MFHGYLFAPIDILFRQHIFYWVPIPTMSQALWQALGHIKVNKKDPVREYVITPLILVQVFLILSVFFFFFPTSFFGASRVALLDGRKTVFFFYSFLDSFFVRARWTITAPDWALIDGEINQKFFFCSFPSTLIKQRHRSLFLRCSYNAWDSSTKSQKTCLNCGYVFNLWYSKNVFTSWNLSFLIFKVVMGIFEDEMRLGIKTLKNVNCHRDITIIVTFSQTKVQIAWKWDLYLAAFVTPCLSTLFI